MPATYKGLRKVCISNLVKADKMVFQEEKSNI